MNMQIIGQFTRVFQTNQGLARKSLCSRCCTYSVIPVTECTELSATPRRVDDFSNSNSYDLLRTEIYIEHKIF